MSLPVIDTPKFTMNLMSVKDPISYRPFLVKEEKLLLMAMEGGEEKDIIDTTKQIISSFGKIRVYLIHNWKIKDKPLIEMGDKELGELWDKTPDIGDINKFVQEMPNYEEPKFDEDEDYHSESCWNNCKAFELYR